VTGKLSELLATFFSPGTGTTVALTVLLPGEGEEDRGTLQLVLCPAVVLGTTVWPLTLDPLSVTLQVTLVSEFCPVLVKLSVNVGAGLAGMVFVEPVCSVVPPTLTEFSE
jgi:hypothetical protein